VVFYCTGTVNVSVHVLPILNSRVRGLQFGADQLGFYIKPEGGMELPAIMQWLKQTFAQRYNALTGRMGHIWGDRYWSEILEGAPPNGGRGARGGIPPVGDWGASSPPLLGGCGDGGGA
jgi:hypothetical protein